MEDGVTKLLAGLGVALTVAGITLYLVTVF